MLDMILLWYGASCTSGSMVLGYGFVRFWGDLKSNKPLVGLSLLTRSHMLVNPYVYRWNMMDVSLLAWEGVGVQEVHVACFGHLFRWIDVNFLVLT